MTKRLTVILLAMLALASIACAQQSQTPVSSASKADKPADSQQPSEPSQKSESGPKVLVAYFSATGVTEGVAKQLAEATGGTLHKIQPEKPYTDADLDWHNKQSRSSVEMADKNSRPAIAGQPQNLAEYDIVYVGFPIWWYTAPTIINTFIESNDLKGKKVIPFATSGGSTIDKACEDLKASYPEVNWQTGKLLNGSTPDELKNWTESHKQ